LEAQEIVICFAEMFALIAKQSPASLPAVPFLIFLSTFLAWFIAFSFNSKNMFRSLDFGVAMALENCIRFSSAVSFPSFI